MKATVTVQMGILFADSVFLNIAAKFHQCVSLVVTKLSA